MKLHEFPRHPLTFGPSPVHQLERLTAHLGGASVWAKREDCNSGLAFGGNKTRKLEYIVPDVLAQGADTLVSIGGFQSNHTRQVAAVAAHLGLKCRLVQEKWVDWDDPVNDKVGNILLSRIMGADVRLDQSGFDIGIRQSWEEAIAEVEAAGGKPYADPGRGLRAPARRTRVRQLGLRGRRAGGAAGGLLRHDRRLHGHRLDARRHDRRLRRAGGPDRPSATRARHRRLRDAGEDPRPGRPDRAHTADLIELGRDLRDDEITVLEGWAGDLYGIPVESTIEAIRLSGRLEGMIIDPVYEGKSMAGLVDLVTSGEIPSGLDGALRPPRRPAGAERLLGDLRLTGSSPFPGTQ